jgi:hypothetical protein
MLMLTRAALTDVPTPAFPLKVVNPVTPSVEESVAAPVTARVDENAPVEPFTAPENVTPSSVRRESTAFQTAAVTT